VVQEGIEEVVESLSNYIQDDFESICEDADRLANEIIVFLQGHKGTEYTEAELAKRFVNSTPDKLLGVYLALYFIEFRRGEGTTVCRDDIIYFVA